jgi:Bacterial Ig-like domain (group 2)
MRGPLGSKPVEVHLSFSKSVALSMSAFTLLLLACDNGMETTDNCFVNLAPITARTNVVSVGDTLTFEASLGPAECLPTGITTENWRWSSTDTLIARIDSLSGLAEGVAPGAVTIQVEHADNSSVASGAGLQVVPQ